ncbi:MAG: beta-N-acetylhexosaminidase [Phycisphaeraceae bacterium]|nr:beta-N-acetylhexosaminidase [Phycisphaeraceae bacterium]
MLHLTRRTMVQVAILAIMLIAEAAMAVPLIIPQPVEMKISQGTFTVRTWTRVVASGEAVVEAQKLINLMAPALGYPLKLVNFVDTERDVITLSLKQDLKKTLGDEGYRLTVTPQRIEVAAARPAGLFYGTQTLRQLLPPDIYRLSRVPDVAWTVPCVRITDYPRFKWRGLLVDPARHFIPKRDMMRYIDAMAMHKFNRLQIHFTDGQGWRIEIKKYPLLTEVGSRWHNQMGQRNDKGRIFGGYYTQQDIRELVRYGAARHVTLVPEIEMPFHAGAAIVAYPRLGFDPEKLEALEPMQRLGKTGNLVVPRASTVAFFKDVLDEVIELFPSEHIHIGGDEANADRWAKVPEMQTFMKDNNLADVHELHSWFIKQMDSHITGRGRKMVGWGEILQGGLAKNATVMSWRSTEAGVTAAKAGHDVVMATTSHTYFDYRQSENKEIEPGGFGGAVIDLAKVYTFEPVPGDLNAEQTDRILGGQGQLWGELIPNERHREYQTYPRACALIETIWSPKHARDYRQFHKRLQYHTKRLEAADVYYRQLDPMP